MEVIFDSKQKKKPRVSLLLLDWSCRESYHLLDYLKDQTADREDYEVIWIEYYGRRPDAIQERLEECKKRGEPAVIDKWIVMDMPEDAYYHKHLMYNLGIAVSRGDIFSIIDSDAIAAKTLVETIINSFTETPNLILHLDEVRNTDRKYYPFTNPTVEEILGDGCINWEDGKTTGIRDTDDTLHTRNYGACMCALRSDLIAISGADEHIDYLGHVCGPYDLTFRLINDGKTEVWHEDEYLYHAWHPGSDGVDNYCGPHDGKNMSTTALGVRRTGRVMPLVENPAIAALRLGEFKGTGEALMALAVETQPVEEWTDEKLIELVKATEGMSDIARHPIGNRGLLAAFSKSFIKQFIEHTINFIKKPKTPGEYLKVFAYAYDLLHKNSKQNLYLMEECKLCLSALRSEGITEVAIYGITEEAELLCKLSPECKVGIARVYSENGAGGKFFGVDILPLSAVKDFDGRVVIAATTGVDAKFEELSGFGVDRTKVVTLR